MTILPLSRQDLSLLGDLQPEGWPDILPFLDFYTQSAFCFPLKVMIDNRITAMGTGIVHGQTGWLGHIIVSPAYRNRGIGKAVTQALIDVLQAQRCTTLYLVATDLGAPVYAKAGFETETEYLFFKDVVTETDPVDRHIVPFAGEHEAQIVALDRHISGEDRTMELSRGFEGCQVYLAGSTLEGFYLPGLGEGLIVAATPTAGVALMKLRLSAFNHAAFPVDNVQATQYLYALGHKEIRRAKRMRLGEERPWHPAGLYNRIAGNIG